jgi:protein-disulfide isomerase
MPKGYTLLRSGKVLLLRGHFEGQTMNDDSEATPAGTRGVEGAPGGLAQIRDWPTLSLVTLAICMVGVLALHIAHPSSRLRQASFAALLAEVSNTGHRLGPPDAPVALLVFFNYRCGFCHQYQLALDLVRTTYPKDVAVIYAPYGASSDSFGEAFLAADCAAAQGAFAAAHRRLLASDAIPVTRNGWQQLGDSLGVARSIEFAECVLTRQFAPRLDKEAAFAGDLGIHGSPTTVVDGRLIVGALPPADLLARVTPLVLAARSHLPGSAAPTVNVRARDH